MITSNTIQEYLNRMNVPHSLKGYLMLADGIELAIKNRRRFVMGNIYIDVASQFDSTPSKVERAMRHAIGKTDAPCTNREFLTRAADELLLRQSKENGIACVST